MADDERASLPAGCTLIEQPAAGTMAAIYRLRVAAWRARTPAFPDMPEWRDDFDDGAMHWAILHEGAPIAAARMTIHAALADLPNAEIYTRLLPADLAGPIASINRLVVDTAWAKRGLPRILDEARVDAARTSGCRHVLGETYAGGRRPDSLAYLGFKPLGLTQSYVSGPLATVKNDRGRRDRLPSAIILTIRTD
jgi:GNAT superfamily N-acetyltransferase